MQICANYPRDFGGSVKVYRDAEWSEYVVKSFDAAGRHEEDGDYHTDDYDDARDTALAICELDH